MGMTSQQRRKFTTLCNQMADFMNDLRKTHPDATLYIEDGSIDIYDWPDDIPRRPDTPLATGGIWMFASGGGK